MKKHILFLSYYFPPDKAIAAVRTGAIAKSLAEAGWKVTVITVSQDLLVTNDGIPLDSEGDIGEKIAILNTGHSYRNFVPARIKSPTTNGPYRFFDQIYRRLIRLLRLLYIVPLIRSLYFDDVIGWGKHAFSASLRFNPGDIDLVLSTGPPWISHVLAAKISKRLNCPYVLDYRDLWIGDPHRQRKWWWINKERKLFKNASAIVTVSPSIQIFQKEIFGMHHNAKVISNGFNSIEFQDIFPKSFNEFAFVYAGAMGSRIRTIDPFFMVLQQLIIKRPLVDWRFHYYGPSTAYMHEAALRCKISDKVIIHGNCSKQEALTAVKGAGLALVVASVAEEASLAEAGILTGKVFEIIGMNTPFLVVAPHNSDIRNIVDEVGGGRVFCGNEIDLMADYALQVIEQGGIPQKNPANYSWEKLGKELSDFLYRCI